MIILDVPQLSPEWFAARCGIPSSSSFGKIYSPTGKPSTQAKTYLLQLAGERLLGKKEEGYQSQAMTDGIDRETESLGWFEYDHDTTVQLVGLCYRNEERKYSCSPDGLIGDDGGFEQKNPILSTHVEYLLADKLPTIYIPQVQGSLMITEREYWWFMSYVPGMPKFYKKVYRDEEYIKKLETELDKFCDKLEEVYQQLLTKVEVG